MKKMLCMILALAMVFSLSVSAMAADITTTGDTSKNVTATYTAGSETSWGDTIYSVNISWETVGSIAYTAGNGVVYTWDATNTEYKVTAEATEGDWVLTAGADTGKEFTGMIVTVTNSSNAKVTATVTANDVSELGVTGGIEGDATRTISSAAPAEPSATNLNGDAVAERFDYKITDIANAPTAPSGNNTITVATITVTLGKTA